MNFRFNYQGFLGPSPLCQPGLSSSFKASPPKTLPRLKEKEAAADRAFLSVQTRMIDWINMNGGKMPHARTMSLHRSLKGGVKNKRLPVLLFVTVTLIAGVIALLLKRARKRLGSAFIG